MDKVGGDRTKQKFIAASKEPQWMGNRSHGLEYWEDLNRVLQNEPDGNMKSTARTPTIEKYRTPRSDHFEAFSFSFGSDLLERFIFGGFVKLLVIMDECAKGHSQAVIRQD